MLASTPHAAAIAEAGIERETLTRRFAAILLREVLVVADLVVGLGGAWIVEEQHVRARQGIVGALQVLHALFVLLGVRSDRRLGLGVTALERRERLFVAVARDEQLVHLDGFVVFTDL